MPASVGNPSRPHRLGIIADGDPPAVGIRHEENNLLEMRAECGPMAEGLGARVDGDRHECDAIRTGLSLEIREDIRRQPDS